MKVIIITMKQLNSTYTDVDDNIQSNSDIETMRRLQCYKIFNKLDMTPMDYMPILNYISVYSKYI